MGSRTRFPTKLDETSVSGQILSSFIFHTASQPFGKLYVECVGICFTTSTIK